MKRKVLIVDDETIVRVTLRSMIRWEDYGMEIAADCNSGFQALSYLQDNSVDLLITDAKMPEMSGIELLRRLSGIGKMPIALVLSGYNEFELVREAFRLGASDYLLKEDLTPESLVRTIKSLGEKYWNFSKEDKEKKDFAQKEKTIVLPESGTYGAAILTVDDLYHQTARFGGNLREMMEIPMLELARQIPRVSKRAQLFSVHPGYIVFLYSVNDIPLYQCDMLSVLRQMQAVWRDYMNLMVSAAVSGPAEAEKLAEVLDKCERMLIFSPLGGKASVTAEWKCENLLQGLEEAEKRYEKLLSCLYSMDEIQFEQKKQECFQYLEKLGQEEAREEILRLIALLARKFREYEEDFFSVFVDEIDYYEKIGRLETMREMELWLNNYLRWEMEYLKNRTNDRQMDVIFRAKSFISDNYANPELTLGTVADYVGFNEKYFTSKFTKETGCTFRDYLTDLRLGRARTLIETTDLKMYEISERVGYNNVEHFNRMFKKYMGISPGDYKRTKRKS